jgi:hypothetical protein
MPTTLRKRKSSSLESEASIDGYSWKDSRNRLLPRCRQVAMTLLQIAEPDGTGWKRTGFSFACNSEEMSAKLAFRNGFLL